MPPLISEPVFHPLPFQGHTAWLADFAITPDGSQLLSIALGDPTVRLWKLDTGEYLGAVLGIPLVSAQVRARYLQLCTIPGELDGRLTVRGEWQGGMPSRLFSAGRTRPLLPSPRDDRNSLTQTTLATPI